jgi:hypothetical protein
VPVPKVLSYKADSGLRLHCAVFPLFPPPPTLYIDTGPCHHGTVGSQVAVKGNGLQMWRVAANILNRQSRIAERG